MFVLAAFLAFAEFSHGFLTSTTSLNLRTKPVHGICSTVANMAGPSDSRRDFLNKLGAFSLGTLVIAPSTNAFEYGAKEGDAAREKYIEDVKSMRAARWTRQPSRLDVDRNVKKFLVVRDVIVDVEDALKNSDLAVVAESIGDQNIEATKKNVNLGLKIPITQRAKPYMYGYAQLFSKKQDSPLTAELKQAADTFFVSITTTRERALAGDLEGTQAGFTASKDALQRYADAIEAETLNGRLNSIRVSVGPLVGRAFADADLDVATENARAVKGDRGKGFL